MTMEMAEERIRKIRETLGDDNYALIADDLDGFTLGYQGFLAKIAELEAARLEFETRNNELRDRIIKAYDRVGNTEADSVTGASSEYATPEEVSPTIFDVISDEGGFIVRE